MRIFLQGTLSLTFELVACCLKYNGKMQWEGGGVVNNLSIHCMLTPKRKVSDDRWLPFIPICWHNETLDHVFHMFSICF